ncbi:MAG: trehalase family glycosidase [Opitutales bacterium]
MTRMTVTEYITANWGRSFYEDKDGSGFKGDDLPFPYTSPCIQGEGHFSFFFYWDTYFTNVGLLIDGYSEMAKNNICNMAWLIRRQGYMPNHTALHNRSQSPYFCRMVTEYFEAIGGTDTDPGLFRECAEALRQEYNFWVTARHTPIGLSHYGHHETAEGLAQFHDSIARRLPFLSKSSSFEDKVRIGGHFMANAEGTCDFSNRFDYRCLDFCQVDLNALLYEYETVLMGYSEQLGWGDIALWKTRQEARAERMQRYFWNDAEGLFYDYDYVNERHSAVPAQTGYQTLFCGVATEAQAARMVENMPKFEREFGMAYTPDVPGARDYQWAYPNVWPPMVWMLIRGLCRYGYAPEAKRLAEKYIRTTDQLFEKTGQLWEKTDAETGEVAGGEYEAAPMIGWSAGVYIGCKQLLEVN